MTYNPFTTENLINEAEFPLTKGGPGSGRTKTLFHIKDWAGNTLFGGKTFPSFEEGWNHIYENVPAEDEEASNYEDYYVQPVNGVWPDEEVSKGGPGSGRRPSAYTTGDIQMSASMQPNAIQYAQNTDDLKEAADESARLADICKGNEAELFQQSLVTNGQAGIDLSSASALFGQAAELHSLASQLANSAAQKYEDGDEEGAAHDHDDAISNAEEATETTDKAIASLVKADPSEMPEQWEGSIPSEYAKSAVRKGGPGSGRKPEGATLDASSFSLPKGMKLKINEDVNPDRQWAEFQPAGATMATITAPSGRKYYINSEYELYQSLPNGGAASTGDELIAAGFDTDEKLSALQDEQKPYTFPYYALTDADGEYLDDDEYGSSLSGLSGKLSDAINEAIGIVAEEEGIDQPKPDTARTWLPTMRIQSLALAGAKLNGQGRQIGVSRMKDLHKSLYTMHMDSAERAITAGNKVGESGTMSDVDLAERLHDLADLHLAAAEAHKDAATKAQTNYEPALAASDASQKALDAEATIPAKGIALMESEPGFRLFDKLAQ